MGSVSDVIILGLFLSTCVIQVPLNAVDVKLALLTSVHRHFDTGQTKLPPAGGVGTFINIYYLCMVVTYRMQGYCPSTPLLSLH